MVGVENQFLSHLHTNMHAHILSNNDRETVSQSVPGETVLTTKCLLRLSSALQHTCKRLGTQHTAAILTLEKKRQKDAWSLMA